MRLYKNILFFLVIGTISVSSCGKDESTDPLSIKKPNYNYFPTTVGNYIEYDVTTIDVEITVARFDTLFFHLREEIAAVFIDNEGRETQKIKRFQKKIGETEWLIKDVWYSNQTTTTGERVEENVRYLNLVFPIIKNKDWNRNVFNSNETELMVYTSVDASDKVGKLSFDSVLTITKEVPPATLLGSSSRVEKHATQVGLVYLKDIEIIKKSNSTATTVTYVDDIYRETEMTVTGFGKK